MQVPLPSGLPISTKWEVLEGDPTDSRMFLLRLDAGGKHPTVQCSGGMGDLFPPQLEL